MNEKMKMLNVEIDETLRHELSEYAKENGLIIKVLVAKLIRSFLDSKKRENRNE